MKEIIKDVLIILLSVVLAVFLVKTGILVDLLNSAKEIKMLGAFVAGLFFTSVFTVAISVTVLGEIVRVNSIFTTAIVGAIGALIGDLIIFRFVKNRLSEHVLSVVKNQKISKRIRHFLRLKLFRVLSFFIGGLIIASPLPDELGIGLLGFSKLKTSLFVPLSLFFNFLGIVIVCFVAKSI